mgnify:CR=1 FL=1
MLGICTRYKHHEATQLAICLADWCHARDQPFSLWTPTESPARLELPYDAQVCATRKLTFTRWARRCKTILWTHVPPVDTLRWCHKQKLRTLIWPLWHEILDTDRESLQLATRVLTASVAQARNLQSQYNVKHVRPLMLDLGLPLTCKDERIRHNTVWVLVPLYDYEPNKTELTTLDIAGRLLADQADVHVTFMYNSSTLGGAGKRRIRDFQRYFRERVDVRRSVSIRDRPLVYGEHDVTLWAAHYDSLGIVPLTSISMGTPVVAFHFPPVTEYLTCHNSVTVACDGSYAPNGAPEVVKPDYVAFERAVRHVTSNRHYLGRLQRSVLQGAAQRRNVFNEVLPKILVDDVV